MWLIGIGLALGAVGLRMLTHLGWRTGVDDLGWMSQQWLAEHRAAVRP